MGDRLRRGIKALGPTALGLDRVTDAIGLTNEPLPPDTSLEDFIRQVSPQAQQLLRGGVQQAIGETQTGTQQAISGLQPFTDLQAFEEQQAILGLAGPEAQAAAIAGIPVNEAQREAQASQMRQQLRQAAAGGDLGSGAALLGSQQLQGAQQAENIFNRLGQLGQLSSVAQGARSSISQLLESGGAREASLLAGLGPAEASILLGGAANIAGARQGQAELQGLQTIAQGQQQQQIANQLSNLIGRMNFNTQAPGTDLQGVGNNDLGSMF